MKFGAMMHAGGGINMRVGRVKLQIVRRLIRTWRWRSTRDVPGGVVTVRLAFRQGRLPTALQATVWTILKESVLVRLRVTPVFDGSRAILSHPLVA